MSVGKSKAVERPVWPWARRYLKRSFVCSGVPKPANLLLDPTHQAGRVAVLDARQLVQGLMIEP